MKKQQIVRLFTLVILSTVLVACSKYEEGSPSIESKKSRLVNHWRVVSITLNNVDITGLNLITEMHIRDNNSITVHGNPLGISTTNNGTWKFDNDKSHVIVTNDDGSVDNFEIVKLEKDSFKVRDTESNGDVYLHEYETY